MRQWMGMVSCQAGIDSLGVLELRNLLSAKFGVHLPATLVVDYPTIHALSAHLVSFANAQGSSRPPHVMQGGRSATSITDGGDLMSVAAELDNLVAEVLGSPIGQHQPLVEVCCR